MPKGKRKAAKRTTDKDWNDLGRSLDDALGKLGGIVGELGYTVPNPGPYRLLFPSGRLAVCDLAALPDVGHVGPVQMSRDGKRANAGHVLHFAKPSVDAIVQASIGDVDAWAIAPDFNAKAVVGRRLGLVRPVSGVLAVGDADIVATLASLRATRKQVPGGPAETLLAEFNERKVELPPLALDLALRAAATGMWHGPVSGVHILVLHVRAKAPVWLRKGLAIDGSQVSLYMDALRDRGMADPVLRRINEREMARARRSKARAAAATPG
ncbi:MAG: hypothetical protein AABX89_05570 [Candidatus Thermoplasmatota archaeon]